MESLKIKFKEFILENGFKILVLNRQCKFFNFNLGIKIGSAYETDNERGFSHFVEHMLFRSNNKFKDYEVNNIIEFLGGDYDAFTDYGSTVLSVNGLDDDLEKCIELISSMVIAPKFDSEELDIERDIIISELDSCYANYEEFSFSKLNEQAFEKSHIKYDVAGNRELLKNVTSCDLIEFHNKYYVPNNAYAVIISSYSEDYIISLFKKYFNSWQRKHISHRELIEEVNIPKTIVTEKSDLEVSTITYLFMFKDLKQSEKILLKLAEYKLGGSSNSILFKKVRDEEGLAYDIYTQLEISDEFQGMYIFCTTSKENVDRAKKIIDESILEIKNCSYNFDCYNLNLMKKLQLIAIYSIFEDNRKLGLYLIEKLIYGKNIESYIEDLKKIESVNKEQIMEVCKKHLNNPTVHILKGK
ncbi:M16 family metallopeptidase [Candidatus Arthromitus sp. SFB-rat-Yit]|uniref:M16 family metallopeptidase n=1 Tax=Candidatus Arthromitus sp. SFB-rat-Yit TaxID=1041504 RepID=UPI000227A383|nr:pitrilysin family protein [Candidatus Arthromitus sp. SFB-rat-Yit]BAK81472.1 zinc protease [Candidatus Arthromitus sp. SFB-rat-Yit]